MRLLVTIPLLAALCLAQAPPGTSEKAWSQLQKELQEAQNKWFGDMRKAREANPRAAIDMTASPAYTFLPRYKALARKYAGTKEAAQAWAFLLARTKSAEERTEAFQKLMEDHLADPALRSAALSLRYRGDEARVREIAEKSTSPGVRGYALLCLAQMKQESDPEGAFALLGEVKEKYGDEEYRPGVTLRRQAEAIEFSATRLRVGKEAPDITGQDIAGQTFSLRDYRGKVVLLDFWGDW